jgi:methionyl-tRNA synthetase
MLPGTSILIYYLFSDFTLNKAVHLVNTDLVNNLANLVSRSTGKQMNPKQKYPSFDLEVMEHVLKGTGEKIVLALNELSGNISFVDYN